MPTLWAQSAPLVINSEVDLRYFAQMVNSGNFSGQTVVLNCDIELDENEDFPPIGTTDTPFQGTFDGQGHWISNLYVNADGQTTGDVAGLFGCVGDQGVVRCVGVRSGIVWVANKSNTDANCYIGGIAGLCAGHIEQCANYATVLGNQTMAFVGGIAGALGNIAGGTTNATIEDCYNRGRVFTSRTAYNDINYLGGIVGICDGAVSRVYVSTDVEISTATEADRIANLSIAASPLANAYSSGNMTGNALDGSLNTQGDYSVWTFADGELPQLTAFIQPSLLGDVNGDGQVTAADATALSSIILGRDSSNYNLDAANTDGVSGITIADLTALVNIFLNQ